MWSYYHGQEFRLVSPYDDILFTLNSLTTGNNLSAEDGTSMKLQVFVESFRSFFRSEVRKSSILFQRDGSAVLMWP